MGGEDNPAKAKLGTLLSDVEWATEQVPGIAVAVGKIGDGPAWTSPMARRVHDDTLGPLATKVRTSLSSLVDDLDQAHRDAPAHLPESRA